MFSATPSDGPLLILDLLPFPNPGAQELRVKMDGPADGLVLEAYSPAMVLLWREEVPALFKGWNSVALPLEMQRTARGLVYVRARPWAGTRQGDWSPPLSLYYLP